MISFKSWFYGTIAGLTIGLSGIALFSDKVHASVLLISLPLAVIFTVLDWKSIKADENS